MANPVPCCTKHIFNLLLEGTAASPCHLGYKPSSVIRACPRVSSQADAVLLRATSGCQCSWSCLQEWGHTPYERNSAWLLAFVTIFFRSLPRAYYHTWGLGCRPTDKMVSLVQHLHHYTTLPSLVLMEAQSRNILIQALICKMNVPVYPVTEKTERKKAFLYISFYVTLKTWSHN